jgi:hypothetical protein
MTLFDWHKADYPRSWSEMSLDFQLMFAWVVGMVALGVLGAALPVEITVILAAALATSFILLSVARRRALHWQWTGARPAEVVSAAFYAVVIAAFLFTGVPLSPPVNTSTLVWYLAGAGFGVFGVLQALNVARMSKADYMRDCNPHGGTSAAESAQTPSEGYWKRTIRAVFMIAFFLVWADLLAAFYFSERAFQNGSPVATAEKTEPIVINRRVGYVTQSEKQPIDLLLTVAAFGIPAAFVCAVLLHFALGVKLFPTPQSWQGRSGKPPF